jgi:hypothetical protein
MIVIYAVSNIVLNVILFTLPQMLNIHIFQCIVGFVYELFHFPQDLHKICV